MHINLDILISEWKHTLALLAQKRVVCELIVAIAALLQLRTLP